MHERNLAKIVTFDSRYRGAFKSLNLAWIEEYFRVEAKDLEQTNNPEHCLNGGGEIFFVLSEERAVGTCALYRKAPGVFELAKMAVDSACRGRGYGNLLMTAAESWARSRAAREIQILSNTILLPAIRLYQRHGYVTIHLGTHPAYERCNIEMRKYLY